MSANFFHNDPNCFVNETKVMSFRKRNLEQHVGLVRFSLQPFVCFYSVKGSVRVMATQTTCETFGLLYPQSSLSKVLRRFGFGDKKKFKDLLFLLKVCRDIRNHFLSTVHRKLPKNILLHICKHFHTNIFDENSIYDNCRRTCKAVAICIFYGTHFQKNACMRLLLHERDNTMHRYAKLLLVLNPFFESFFVF